mgnify:CR=1 FL=1
MLTSQHSDLQFADVGPGVISEQMLKESLLGCCGLGQTHALEAACQDCGARCHAGAAELPHPGPGV